MQTPRLMHLNLIFCVWSVCRYLHCPNVEICTPPHLDSCVCRCVCAPAKFHKQTTSLHTCKLFPCWSLLVDHGLGHGHFKSGLTGDKNWSIFLHTKYVPFTKFTWQKELLYLFPNITSNAIFKKHVCQIQSTLWKSDTLNQPINISDVIKPSHLGVGTIDFEI